MAGEERKTVRIPVLMTPRELSALDDWAFANRVRSRGEAIRRLIEAGIKALDAKRTATKKPKRDQDRAGPSPLAQRISKPRPDECRKEKHPPAASRRRVFCPG